MSNVIMNQAKND